MDSVELPLPTAIVTKIMRSSGCSGGGGVTRVELLGSQSERETCSSSFRPEKDDISNLNGSKPAFWNKISDDELYRQASQMSSLRNEETFMDHDMASVPEAKQSQRKSGKSSRSNGNSSRRSRVAHMEASSNLTGVIDVSDLSKELGSYPGKCNITEKTQTNKQKTSVSGKRSEKRNGKIHKSKSDSFSVKAGLSSFSSSAGGNNILGVFGSKHDLCDFTKNVDEVSLKELLDGSYKSPKSLKEKEAKTETLNGSILSSVREACSILQLQKPTQTPNVAAVDSSYNQNTSSSLPNSTTNDDTKGDAPDPSSNKKVDNSFFDQQTNILQFPLFAPKDVLDRLRLPPHKELDLMLLDSMKPTSTSKVQNGGSLPTFPWSHVSGGHFKANPDGVKSTPSKTTCQGRWVRMGKLVASSGQTSTASSSYLADLESLTYNQNLVPVASQQSNANEKGKSPLAVINNTALDRGTRTTTSKAPAVHSSGVLTAAQTLCDIATKFRKQDQNGIIKWQKKPSQKSSRSTKLLTSDEALEKALFTIPSSRSTTDDTKTHNTPKKLRLTEKSNELSHHTKPQYHWPISTPQSSRSSPGKSSFKNTPSTEPKLHHESSSSSNPLKRSITAPPSRLSNKPSKLRKLLPMEWKSRSDQKGNGKY